MSAKALDKLSIAFAAWVIQQLPTFSRDEMVKIMDDPKRTKGVLMDLICPPLSEAQSNEVFGGIIPTTETLAFIKQKEVTGWVLVATRSNVRSSSPVRFHNALKTIGNVLHYQMSGTLHGAIVSLNLYFMRPFTG